MGCNSPRATSSFLQGRKTTAFHSLSLTTFAFAAQIEHSRRTEGKSALPTLVSCAANDRSPPFEPVTFVIAAQMERQQRTAERFAEIVEQPLASCVQRISAAWTATAASEILGERHVWAVRDGPVVSVESQCSLRLTKDLRSSLFMQGIKPAATVRDQSFFYRHYYCRTAGLLCFGLQFKIEQPASLHFHAKILHMGLLHRKSLHDFQSQR